MRSRTSLRRCRQVSQPLQALLENVKLLPVRQGALQQQVGDLFKRRVRREVLDVITAVGQADTFLAYGADGGRSRGLSAQTVEEMIGLASLINLNFLIFCK